MPAGLAAAVGWGSGASAQPIGEAPSLLPATGTTVNTGDLRQSLERAFGGGLTAGSLPLPLVITPAIDLQQEYDDNGSIGRDGRGRSSLITVITPSVTVSGETAHIRANLAYSPNIYLYETGGGQSRIGHQLNANALITVVPDLFFVDIRGYATEQATRGGLGPVGTNSLGRDRSTQSVSFSVSPYLTHRFGGTGTAELGASLSETLQDQNGRADTRPNIPGTPGYDPFLFTTGRGNQNLTTTNFHAAFTTGEDFGRVKDTLLASLSQYDGGGVLSSAHRNTYTSDTGYALTRQITLLGTVGYEDIRYSGTPPTRINDLLWQVGVRLLPNPDSSLTVRYGHRDGFNSASFDASYAPTARIRLFARYSEGLTTDEEQLQNALAIGDVDPYGTLLDSATGAPLVPVGNFYGVNNDLSRERSISLTGVLEYDRDIFTASLSHQRRRRVATASPTTVGSLPVGGSDDGTYGSVTWGRELSPSLHSSLLVQYGVRNVSGPVRATETTLVTTASATYIISATVSSSVSYSRTQNSSQFSTSNQTENLIVVGVHKSF